MLFLVLIDNRRGRPPRTAAPTCVTRPVDDMLFADLLAQLAYVYVDRAVAHDDLVAPDAGVDLLACEELAGL